MFLIFYHAPLIKICMQRNYFITAITNLVYVLAHTHHINLFSLRYVLPPYGDQGTPY